MRNILLVEDCENLSLLYKDTLFDRGFNVSSACDGKEGLEKVLSQSFDLIVSDNNMPRMSGEDFVHAVVSMGYSMPILLHTGDYEYVDSLKKKFVNHKVLVAEKSSSMKDFLKAVEEAYKLKEKVRIYGEF